MDKPLKVHFMGIGGAGISAVAQIAQAQGYQVSGCDLELGRNTHYLEKAGISVSLGHDAEHLKNIDLLAHTPAVFYQSETNPEYTNAQKRKIAMTWEEFMAKYLMQGKVSVAVAGTHGKGTTGAMLARILETAGIDPTVELGANLLDWEKRNFRIGQGRYFLCEADEYHDNFSAYKPSLILITSIEMDHPDYFKDFAKLLETFAKFVGNLQGEKILVLNKDDAGCRELAKKVKVKVIWYNSKLKLAFKLQLPGEHFRQDARGAAVAARALGVKDVDIIKGLEKFGGLERRFEFKGEYDGVKVYDDYAHHPTAVQVNIQAARELYPKKKIWIVIQPHMYSRLSLLFDDFVKVLKKADRVIVSDVYTRREQGVSGPSGKELATAVGPIATYVGGDLLNVANFVKRNTTKSDVVLVFGAGDSYRVAEYLVNND